MQKGWCRVISDLREWPSSLVGWVLAEWWWLLAGFLVVVLVGGSVWVWWYRRAVAALQHRSAVHLVPGATFEPTVEETVRHAAWLRRVPAAAWPLPRRAGAVRTRISGEGGVLRYSVEGPQQAAGVLQVPSYSGVEVVTDRARAAVPRVRFAQAPLEEVR